MTCYGGVALANAFRTVRKNTITIAEEIPAEQYAYRAAPGVRTVGEMLAHIAVGPRWHMSLHGDRVSFVDFEYFGRSVARAATEEQGLTTKDDILAALREGGERFAAFLEGFTEEELAEEVRFPAPVTPSSKTRFEMLLSAKEHEMHHRAQLMLIERQLGIVPHITRARQAAQAQVARA
jgi:uncharacterized damage-inducible protein DinB